VLSL
jgi:hypothetical protein